ncbi:MAG: TetR/AcrR family transcriptional regulator [Gammaproteobacteria bacterium]|uniref:TetR/AcrR family transcriptional regulator n=1 Tax=Pseudomaricurvus alcaniphilus TaxID=1166482 RepID=UPI00140CF8E0|nr:TetR/AcrR family transcriptional regulator [Pseudomaricurvus alcaniphilus]MBR9909316.1 TetR/AcrR family transcriptional regulator [Gammaproteobacteria bacterium]NHN38252.1 TetR/AcrR family transcriptional regulator [Pseudomaricurvus alcaniphilus]
MAAVPTAEDNEDFRVRVAREKRERMRLRLQDAAIEVYSQASLARMPVVEDVIKAAAVSRGTFYKYYPSLEELLADIGQQVAGDVLQTYRLLVVGGDNAAATNLLLGPVLSMVHAGMESARASITARLDFVEYFSRDNNMKKILAGALVKARSDAVIEYDHIDAATDYVVGATLEAIRRLARSQQVDEHYIKTVAGMIARGLGMSPAVTRSAVDSSWHTIQASASRLPWWQPEIISRA